VARLGDFFRNLFGSVLSRSDPLDRVATYVIREHERGRPLVEILDDPYVRNRTTPDQLAHLLDNPEVVRALGKDVVQTARATLT
jgi:hypothetical protein